MIIDEYMIWKQGEKAEREFDKDYDEFMQFAQEHIGSFVTVAHLLKDLMYQIYCLQCCVEGIIEDMEGEDERKEEEEKGKKGNGRVEGGKVTQWIEGRTSC